MKSPFPLATFVLVALMCSGCETDGASPRTAIPSKISYGKQSASQDANGHGVRVSEKRVKKLMDWVDDKLGTKTPTLPVVIASKEKFQEAIESNGQNVEYLDVPDKAGIFLPGMYIHNANTFDLSSPEDVSHIIWGVTKHANLFRKNVSEKQKRIDAGFLEGKWIQENTTSYASDDKKSSYTAGDLVSDVFWGVYTAGGVAAGAIAGKQIGQ